MSSDGRRRVNFSDSPPGGSKSSSRQNSDSGVGSSSDHRPTASAGANPDRSFTERDIERQWYDLGALQSAYRVLFESESRIKSKLRDLEEENSRLRRTTKDADVRFKEELDENKKLKDQYRKIDDERKLLAEENAQLKGDVNALHTQRDEDEAHIRGLEQQLRASPVPEVMSGAIPRDAAPPKIKRRDSVSKSRDSKRESKREEKDAEKEKKRLSKRFDLKDGSEAVSKPPNSSRSRRESTYIEPLGPAAPPSRGSVRVPASPTTATTPSTRQFSSYSQAPHREPTYAELPRTVLPSVRPGVTVHESYPDEGVSGLWREDGQYRPYPLPPKPPKSRHHSEYSR